jgi:glutamyl-tRNA synthetase
MSKKAEDIQDFAIVRSDGSPIFHIANVVDDIDQRVTHIIRGDDHVENTFKHICIFRALGAEIPKYAHLSMIVNQQGKPYSKRDGAAFVGEYREQGFMPEALFNYLLLLGWNPGDDREVISREEMVKLFDLEKVHVTAAKFDFKKLSWMNGEYIKSIEPQKFRDLLVEAASCSGNYKVPLRPDITTDESRLEWWNYLSSQIQIRTKALANLDEPIKCFISDDYPFDEKAIEKRLKKPGVKPLLLDLVERFANAAQWKAADLEAVVKELSQGNGMGPWVHPIRVAVSGRGEGIGLFEMLELLGREKTLSRLKNAAENLASE